MRVTRVPEPDRPPPPPDPTVHPGGARSSPRSATPTVLDAGLVLLAFVGGQLVVGGALAAAAAVAGLALEGALTLALVVAAQVGGALAVALVLALRRRWTRALLGPAGVRPVHVAEGLVAGAVGVLLAYGINALLVLATGSEAPVQQVVLEELLRGPLALTLGALAAVVVAPAAEELVFRGVALPALTARVGAWPAALVTAALFTLAHVEVVTSQPLALVGLLALGVWLARTVHRTGSLVVAIVAHATFNLTSLGLAVAASTFGIG